MDQEIALAFTHIEIRLADDTYKRKCNSPNDQANWLCFAPVAHGSQQ